MSAIVQVEKITSSLSPNGFYEKVNEVIDQNNNVHDLVQEAEEVIERVDKVIPSDASESNKVTSKAYVDAKFVAEGVTDAERAKWNAYTTNKQDTLTQAQLDAVNSGITLSKVAQYDGYATGKADASYSYSKNDTDYKINAAIDTCKNYTYSQDQIKSEISSAITTAKTTLEPKLTWDWNPTVNSQHAIYSGGVYQAISNLSSSISGTYQTKLTFDSAPDSTSSRPVTSAGIYTAVYTGDHPNASCGYATKAGTVDGGAITGTATKDLVYAQMADNDLFRIRVGGTEKDAGYVEIATADNAQEPIYARQYSGSFDTLTRTAILLDSSGNTSFPGNVDALNFTKNGSTLEFTAPVGSFWWYAGSSVPSGYLLCNGAPISRTSYSQLYNVIGTIYGEGDGSATFNLPNLIDRFIEGSSTPGTTKSASVSIPSHYHVFGYNNSNNTGQFLANSSGCTFTPVAGIRGWNGSGGGGGYESGSLTVGNMITSYAVNGSGTSSVQPPSITLLPIIKY